MLLFVFLILFSIICAFNLVFHFYNIYVFWLGIQFYSDASLLFHFCVYFPSDYFYSFPQVFLYTKIIHPFLIIYFSSISLIIFTIKIRLVIAHWVFFLRIYRDFMNRKYTLKGAKQKNINLHEFPSGIIFSQTNASLHYTQPFYCSTVSS